MSRYELNRFIFDLGRRPDPQAAVAEKLRLVDDYQLAPAERRALLVPDFSALLELGALTNLVFRYYRYHRLDVARFAERVRADRDGAESDSVQADV